MRRDDEERDAARRRSYDMIEAAARAQNAEPVEDKPLALGEPVAWISRDNGKASFVSAVHHHYEDGFTFCRLAIPPRLQHLSILPSLDVCSRCRKMSARAMHYAKIAAMQQQDRASA